MCEERWRRFYYANGLDGLCSPQLSIDPFCVVHPPYTTTSIGRPPPPATLPLPAPLSCAYPDCCCCCCCPSSTSPPSSAPSPQFFCAYSFRLIDHYRSARSCAVQLQAIISASVVTFSPMYGMPFCRLT